MPYDDPSLKQFENYYLSHIEVRIVLSHMLYCASSEDYGKIHVQKTSNSVG